MVGRTMAWRALAGACAVLSALVLAAGCARVAPRPAPSPSRRPATAAPVRRAAAAITVIRLYRSGLGLAGLTTRPGGGGYARLLESTDFGATFRVISPVTGRYTIADDIWALNRSLIWFDAFSTVTARERLYWTRDGGRSWHSAAVPGHSLNAGATSSIQLTTPEDGWMTVQEPTGPGADLYRTADGGAAWHMVAGGPPSPLRQVAPVEADPAKGLWQAGGLFSDRLEHSTDGGKRWQAFNLTGAPRATGTAATPQPWYSLPAFFPHQILTAVAVPHRNAEHLLVYASGDRGRTWARVSDLPLPGPARPLGLAPVRVAFAGPRAWWALVPGRHPRLFLTADSGRRWRQARLPAATQAWELAAAGASHAWVLVTTASGSPAIAITEDGGRAWHLVTFRGTRSRATQVAPGTAP
jgi:hypothetical protein